MKLKMGSYKICQICNGPIVRNGKTVHTAIGLGFRKVGKPVHKYCLNKLTKDKLVKVQFNNQASYILV